MMIAPRAAIKRVLVARAGGPMQDCELDHIVSLDLGGAPLDPRNLKLQPWAGPCNARQKDVLEIEMAKAVCEGDVSLVDAQREIARDWITAYKNWINSEGCDR
jgi:hypothetical protein